MLRASAGGDACQYTWDTHWDLNKMDDISQSYFKCIIWKWIRRFKFLPKGSIENHIGSGSGLAINRGQARTEPKMTYWCIQTLTGAASDLELIFLDWMLIYNHSTQITEWYFSNPHGTCTTVELRSGVTGFATGSHRFMWQVRNDDQSSTEKKGCTRPIAGSCMLSFVPEVS